MDRDYPSAHSMDTHWFAVDRDGHVAAFWSGEAGAVPLKALAGEGAADVEERVRELLPAGEAVHDLRGRAMPGGAPEGLMSRAWTGQFPVLLFLTSLDPVRDALDRGEAVELAATEGKAVLFRRLDDEALKRYLGLPECQASCNVFASEEGEDPSLARFGFYEYRHLTDNWISGPYGREAIPRRPLHIDELPPELRRRVGNLRFDNLRFADTLHLQPVEHARCDSWESAYIDVTGKHIRPIPGKEGQYGEAYEQLSDIGDQFQVEPPPEGG